MEVNRMNKISKNKLLASAVILLLIGSAYLYFIPATKASPASVAQRGFSILDTTVGLDLPKYAVAWNTYPNTTFAENIPQENVEYQLVSDSSKLNVLCTFANGNLQMLKVLDKTGSPILSNQPSSNVVENARNFLSDYQTLTGRSIYGQLESTLSAVEEGKNLTQISGNAKLEINTVSNGDTTFKWTYIFNGILAPTKFLSLGFSNNDLSFFVDNWQLYTIGSTKVAVSDNQAKTISLDTAKNHFSNAPLDNDTFDSKNFNLSNIAFTALLFDRSACKDELHNGDPLTLYPVWRVGVQLNKWYGDLYGVEVDMYADTGQVIATKDALSSLHPHDYVNANTTTDAIATKYNAEQTENTLSLKGEANLSLAILLLASASMISVVAILIVKRPQLKKQFSGFKIDINSKVHAVGVQRRTVYALVLISVLVVSVLSMLAVPSAQATEPIGAAVIWGSESQGQLWGQSEPYFYWRKQLPEIILQHNEALWIEQYFINSGWTGIRNHGINRQGPGSYRADILADLEALQSSNAANVAIIDFDHGVGRKDYSGDPGIFHYMFEDYRGTMVGDWDSHSEVPGNAVYDHDIFTRTNDGEVTFAFISTCLSSDYWNSCGALTYETPDTYYWITQGHLPSGTVRGLPYAFTHRYVEPIDTPGFNIEYAISSDGYNEPDTGDQVYIGFPKGSASLTQCIPDPTTSGYMYGVWVSTFFSYLLHPYHYSVHNALDTATQLYWGCDFDGYNSPLYRYNQYGGFQPYWYLYTGEQPPEPWDKGWMDIFGNAGMTLPYIEPQFLLTTGVNDPTMGSVSPTTQYYTIGTQVQLTATGSQPYYVLDHWTIDGVDNWQTNPIITMNQAHTAIAHFRDGRGWFNVYFGAYADTEYYGEPFSIDGNGGFYTGNGYWLIEGWHTIEYPTSIMWGMFPLEYLTWFHDGTYTESYTNTIYIYVDENGQQVWGTYHYPFLKSDEN
jgi:hypothetical protein